MKSYWQYYIRGGRPPLLPIIKNVWPSATTHKSEQWIQAAWLAIAEHDRELSKRKTKVPFIVCTSCSNDNTVCLPPYRRTALPPLHLRPNDGWERRNDGCSLSIIWLIFPDIRSSQWSLIVADLRRLSDATPACN